MAVYVVGGSSVVGSTSGVSAPYTISVLTTPSTTNTLHILDIEWAARNDSVVYGPGAGSGANAGKFKSIVGPSVPIKLVLASSDGVLDFVAWACHYVSITIDTT